MNFVINFLSAHPITTPLAKRFEENTTYPYPNITNFSSYSIAITSLGSFFNALIHHARQGHALLKGVLNHPLSNQSRAGSTDSRTPTQYLVLDVDNVPPTTTSIEQYISTCLPSEFHSVSYIFQASNSAGITKPLHVGHLFFLLQTPQTPQVLKNQLKHWNLHNEHLNALLHLSHNGHTLCYSLDVTVAQNDKLIYIANPSINGRPDPYANQDRIKLVTKQHETLQLIPTDNRTLPQEIEAKIKELRTALHLPNKKARYKYDNNDTYLINPERAIFTPVYNARGFVYGNLGNGDSCAYFHSEKNPKFLSNFKGEPKVLLQDIDPEYWLTLYPQSDVEEHEEYIVGRDTELDSYFTMTINTTEQTHKINYVSNSQKAIDFLRLRNCAIPDPLPEYQCIFAPNKNFIIDKTAHIINLWQQSIYLRNATYQKVPIVPKKFNELTSHITNNDPTVQADLLNWLAFILQYKEKTQTAWILHGTTGTGKGVLFHKILTPILGQQYCANIGITQLDEPFNSWLQKSLLILINETKTDQNKDKQRELKIKDLITESTSTLRLMRTNPIQHHNFANFIFASNEYDAVKVEHNDRRFKVAPRQESPINYTETDLAELEQELQAITNYLISIPVNKQAAQRPLINQARADLIETTQDSIDEFIKIIKTGDIAILETYKAETATIKNIIHKEQFDYLVSEWSKNTNKPLFISTSNLRTIYNYLFNTDISPHKFGRLLANKAIKVSPRHINGVTARFVTITWTKDIA